MNLENILQKEEFLTEMIWWFDSFYPKEVQDFLDYLCRSDFILSNATKKLIEDYGYSYENPLSN